ncbi:Na(+)/H(+) antiporter subunit C [Agromyces archimandritae]|uniref:Na(+)/H(+) antiporter subunit C n=1 Tax=Agromyces archimandritae TaxID=2781962 RepID=A0A975FQ16_9MICO|nr:Na(+)/H(+) antiporter subunit C [Agromyces archimandritae]QTX05717.1 Na(+)/H(+) antiporter subunit C [Agromyces archimandritae]
MTASLTLLVLMAVLFGSGIYVMLERSLTRVLIGFLLVGNAVNILIYLMSGAPGLAPLMHEGVDESEISDPVPQAFILTAIVINLGITAFMLALIYRSWWLAQLGDKGDLIDDEDEDLEDAEEAEELVRSSHEDDEAIQSLIDASDEEFDDEFDDDFDSAEAEIDREPEDESVLEERADPHPDDEGSTR